MKIPKYVKVTASRLCETKTPYVFRLYGRDKLGAVGEHTKECSKLLDWAMRNGARTQIIARHFWWDEDMSRDQAYRKGFRNYFLVKITDPVCLQFERDGFYREETL